MKFVPFKTVLIEYFSPHKADPIQIIINGNNDLIYRAMINLVPFFSQATKRKEKITIRISKIRREYFVNLYFISA
jgi:hypothetical protein